MLCAIAFAAGLCAEAPAPPYSLHLQWSDGRQRVMTAPSRQACDLSILAAWLGLWDGRTQVTRARCYPVLDFVEPPAAR